MELNSILEPLLSVRYLWLSFRIPLSFPVSPEIIRIKEQVEENLEFALEGMRKGRGKRLEQLGRRGGPEEKRERRRENRAKFRSR